VTRKRVTINLEACSLDGEAGCGAAPPRDREHSFLAGPLDWRPLDRAADLGGRALHLWLVLNHRARLCRKRGWPLVINLKRVGIPHGFGEWAARRALWALEEARLVEVARQPGCAVEVTLLNPDPSGERS
jgi:hypothetical protein